MRHDDRYGNVAQRSLAIGRSNPRVCTGYPDRFDVDADRNPATGSLFEKVLRQRGTAGAKNGNNSNLAAEHGDLLVVANF